MRALLWILRVFAVLFAWALAFSVIVLWADGAHDLAFRSAGEACIMLAIYYALRRVRRAVWGY